MTEQIQSIGQEYWKDKCVLITGGTAGLGRAIVEYLHEYGANVAIVARNRKGFEKFKGIPRIFPIQGDVSDKEAIHKISGAALGQLGGIDILINNASYLGPTPLKSLLDSQCEDFEEVLQTNLLGPFRLTKNVIPTMKLSGSGLIVNISSDAAIQAYPTWGPYSVSKAALDHMSRIWNQELKNANIKVVSVDPGDMFTKMHMDAIPDANADDLYHPKDVALDLLEFLAGEITYQDRYSASEWRGYL